jgi:hypothetical protein
MYTNKPQSDLYLRKISFLKVKYGLTSTKSWPAVLIGI